MENKDIIAYKLSKLYILMELYINKDSEQWRNIKDFENYQISDYGRLKKIYKNKFKIKKPWKHGNLYLMYDLWKNSHNNHFSAYNLVINSFDIANPENKNTIDHINKIRSDNRLCNLQYANRKEQAKNRRKVSRNITQTVGAREVWKINKSTREKIEKFISILKAAEHIKITQNL